MKKRRYASSLTLQRNAFKDAEDALIIETFYEFCDKMEDVEKEVTTKTRRQSCSHLKSSMLAMRNFLDGKRLCRLIQRLGASSDDMVGFDKTATVESFKARQNVNIFKTFCENKWKISAMFGYNDIESCNLHAVATGLFKIAVLILSRSEKDKSCSNASKFIPSSLKNIIAWRRLVRKKPRKKGDLEKIDDITATTTNKNLIVTDADSKRTYFVPAHTLRKKKLDDDDDADDDNNDLKHHHKIDLSAITVLNSETGEEMSLCDATRKLKDKKKIHLARDGHTGRVFRVRIDVMDFTTKEEEEKKKIAAKSHARRKWTHHRDHLSDHALAIAGATVKCVVCGQRLPICRIDSHVKSCFVPSSSDDDLKERKTIEPSPALRAALERGDITVQEFKQIFKVERKSRMMGDLTTIDAPAAFADDIIDGSGDRSDQIELCVLQ